jgi:hypothetical protein
MLKTASKIALVSLFVASPAVLFAQSSQQVQPPAAAPSDSESTKNPAVPFDGQIVRQSETTILAGDLLGATVYTPNSEALGAINDLIVSRDGTVEGVVIGIGGFLGIGEKEVAFRMDKLKRSSIEDGEDRFWLNVSREELQAAPSFKTVRQQRAEADAARAAEELRREQREQQQKQQKMTPPVE